MAGTNKAKDVKDANKAKEWDTEIEQDAGFGFDLEGGEVFGEGGVVVSPQYTEDDVDTAIQNLSNDLSSHQAMAGTPARVAAASAVDACWETEINIISTCGASPKSVDVNILPVVKAKINALMKKYTRIEWLAYLVGDKETNTITDIVIPKQTVTTVNVFVKGNVDVPIIGVMHSHHDMGNGFSHTDDEYINQNHDISLCVTHTKITGQVRVKTACGAYVMVDAKVCDVEPIDTTDFMKEAVTLITEQTYTYRKPVTTHYANYGVGASATPGANATKQTGVFPKAYKNVVGCVSKYMQTVKATETSAEGFDENDKMELGFLISLLRAVNTTDFDEIEDMMFSQDLGGVISENCFSLVDEVSIYRTELTSIDYVNIKKLLDYIEKLAEAWYENK